MSSKTKKLMEDIRWHDKKNLVEITDEDIYLLNKKVEVDVFREVATILATNTVIVLSNLKRSEKNKALAPYMNGKKIKDDGPGVGQMSLTRGNPMQQVARARDNYLNRNK